MSRPQSERFQLNTQSECIAKYRAIVERKRVYLFFKRAFDTVVSALLICCLSPVLIVTALAVGLTSRGGVFFTQRRVGLNGRIFKIIKFRTMVPKAASMGREITVGDDKRVTAVGRFIRRIRLDELPQFFNVLTGDMSLIGPRPEVEHYVNQYDDAEQATLLVRPGLSCRASLLFADEAKLLAAQPDPEKYYVNIIMKQKAQLNLEYIENMSFAEDIKTFFATIAHVFK